MKSTTKWSLNEFLNFLRFWDISIQKYSQFLRVCSVVAWFKFLWRCCLYLNLEFLYVKRMKSATKCRLIFFSTLRFWDIIYITKIVSLFESLQVWPMWCCYLHFNLYVIGNSHVTRKKSNLYCENSLNLI